jgi:hypothetical protein
MRIGTMLSMPGDDAGVAVLVERATAADAKVADLRDEAAYPRRCGVSANRW